MDKFNILLKKFQQGTLSDDERALFLLYLNREEFARERNEWLDQLWLDASEEHDTPNENFILHQILAPERMKKRAVWLKFYAAAAIILVFLLAGMVTYWYRESMFQKDNLAHSPTLKEQKIVLMDANGRKVILRDDKKEIVIGEDIKYTDGTELSLEGIESQKGKELTITVPEGRIYRILLSDGTKVTLNSLSSLRFPAQFDVAGRKVQLQGEGYFEVQSDVTRPFYVETVSGIKPLNIRVTGTRFNVNAYDGESASSVALIEGKVDVNQQFLTPGYRYNQINGKSFTDHFDADYVLAWLREEFRFENESLYSVLRQMERWYGVRFEIERVVDERVRIGGAISKDKDLSEMLELLSRYTDVKFKVNNEKVTVGNRNN